MTGVLDPSNVKIEPINRTNEPIDLGDGGELLQPGYAREYEFLHGYNDITIEELDKRVEDFNNDPLAQILMEEIQKEINREVIQSIKVKINDSNG
jgi:hypothetical protein